MKNILIVFDSVTGNIEKLASKVATSFESTAQVRVRKVKPIEHLSKESKDEIVSDADVKWADAYIICTPIYTGTFTAGIKYFIDSQHAAALEGTFLNKPFTAVAIGTFEHAGAETAIQQLYTVAMQWGMLIVSTSIANKYLIQKDENPYGLSFAEHAIASLDVADILKEHFNRFEKIVDITIPLTRNQSEQKGTFNIIDALS